MTRAFTVGATVGIVCAAGAATATTAVAATPTTHVATKTVPASAYARDVDDTVEEIGCGNGLFPPLNFCD